jgi:hypothetical protein
MTTNVPRGAGRGAHSARTARAAQRTPLPPRTGTRSLTGRGDVAAAVRADLGIACLVCDQEHPYGTPCPEPDGGTSEAGLRP